MTNIRIRLVFVDDVGHHVQRQRGFSSCWYLVPTDAKLVGDLAHALLLEFELRKRCPKGLELRLEELPLLATQSVRIVRDDDTIVVQCPLLEDADSRSSDASSSKSEAAIPKQRKRTLRVKTKAQTHEQPKKKVKTVKEVKKRQNAKVKSCAKIATKTPSTSKKSSKEESLDSSSDSSSNSSVSSSSSDSDNSRSSESEEELELRCHRKRATEAVTAQPQTKGSATATASINEPIKANALEQKGKQSRRRRRRLRQRSGGWRRNGNQANTTDNSTGLASSTGNHTASLRREHVATTSDHADQASSAGRQNGGSSAGPRGYPRSKAHVLFDQQTGDQVTVQHDENVSDTRQNDWDTRQNLAPELAKYGPSSSDYQQSRTPRNHQDQTATSSSNAMDDEAKYFNGAPKRKEKGKYEERWKRPYEIVATVLGKKSEMLSKSSPLAPDLTKSLASYPTAAAASCCFEPKDVIAFKTLTLCLETWQPVVSDWRCGEVQSVDALASAIEVSSWTLKANDNSVDFSRSSSGERNSVQTSEISELRFLSGPSYTSLRQTQV